MSRLIKDSFKPNDKYITEYSRWLSSKLPDSQLLDELQVIAGDEDAIADRFRQHLEFGTGGLRGIIGAGTNRMNVLTVARASRGLADCIKANGADAACIAYDTRRMSREFAETAAEVLCAQGIRVYMFTTPHPTPMLSFAVREKKAFSGIVITASHNPREYNGYKVYGADGGQITDAAAGIISMHIGKYDVLDDTPRMKLSEARSCGLLFDLDDVDQVYFEKVKLLVIRKDMLTDNAGKLRILYTPLHGTGSIPIQRVLSELGFTELLVVPEQQNPDGDFSTVKSPNPEDPSVFELARHYAETFKPDLIFATDPDCDRIGVLVRDSHGRFRVLSGSQTGALLCDYIIMARKETMTLGENPAIIKTIVTTELARAICENNGVSIFDTLTGFKYIGEKIGEWERSGEHTFLFGFEESFGYLSGDFVRDKDAVTASVLICEMGLYYKMKGLSLSEALENLYRRYGFEDERLISKTLEGESGAEKIAEIMRVFRNEPFALLRPLKIIAIEDYLTGKRRVIVSGEELDLTQPRSDVIKFCFPDGWLAVRPSGTEPKIKFYLGASGADMADVKQKLDAIERIILTCANQ